MHILDEVFAEGDQEEDAQEAAQQGGEEDLPEVDLYLGVFGLQDVEPRDGENGAGHDHTGGGADGLDNDILSQRILAAEGGGGPHGDDGDGDGCLEHLSDLESRVGCRGGEDDRHQQSHAHRPGGDLLCRPLFRQHRLVLLSRLQLAVRVARQFHCFLVYFV